MSMSMSGVRGMLDTGAKPRLWGVTDNDVARLESVGVCQSERRWKVSNTENMAGKKGLASRAASGIFECLEDGRGKARPADLCIHRLLSAISRIRQTRQTEEEKTIREGGRNL